MICDRCHQEKATAFERINPYDADVNNDEHYEVLCDACYSALADDV